MHKTYIIRPFFVVMTFVFLFINNIYARFANLQDADISYDFYNRNISINEDCTSGQLHIQIS